MFDSEFDDRRIWSPKGVPEIQRPSNLVNKVLSWHCNNGKQMDRAHIFSPERLIDWKTFAKLLPTRMQNHKPLHAGEL